MRGRYKCCEMSAQRKNERQPCRRGVFPQPHENSFCQFKKNSVNLSSSRPKGEIPLKRTLREGISHSAYAPFEMTVGESCSVPRHLERQQSGISSPLVISTEGRNLLETNPPRGDLFLRLRSVRNDGMDHPQHGSRPFRCLVPERAARFSVPAMITAKGFLTSLRSVRNDGERGLRSK